MLKGIAVSEGIAQGTRILKRLHEISSSEA